MNKLVKLITNDDGDENGDDSWHLVIEPDGANRTCCTGEVFGPGESYATYEYKELQKGGITCRRCIEIIKWYKSIKL